MLFAGTRMTQEWPHHQAASLELSAWLAQESTVPETALQLAGQSLLSSCARLPQPWGEVLGNLASFRVPRLVTLVTSRVCEFAQPLLFPLERVSVSVQRKAPAETLLTLLPVMKPDFTFDICSSFSSPYSSLFLSCLPFD